GANVDLIANIVLSILLELSIFSCHVAMRRTRKNSSYSNGQKRTQKSTPEQRAQGTDDSCKSAEKRTKSAAKVLSIDELARIILERGDADLTYRQLEKKYSLSSAKVKAIKDYLQHDSTLKNGTLQLVQ
ncbi:MAG: hypothetical protein ACRC7P_08700, partial [Enterovibrio sp.]